MASNNEGRQKSDDLRANNATPSNGRFGASNRHLSELTRSPAPVIFRKTVDMFHSLPDSFKVGSPALSFPSEVRTPSRLRDDKLPLNMKGAEPYIPETNSQPIATSISDQDPSIKERSVDAALKLLAAASVRSLNEMPSSNSGHGSNGRQSFLDSRAQVAEPHSANPPPVQDRNQTSHSSSPQTSVSQRTAPVAVDYLKPAQTNQATSPQVTNVRTSPAAITQTSNLASHTASTYASALQNHISGLCKNYEDTLKWLQYAKDKVPAAQYQKVEAQAAQYHMAITQAKMRLEDLYSGRQQMVPSASVSKAAAVDPQFQQSQSPVHVHQSPVGGGGSAVASGDTVPSTLNYTDNASSSRHSTNGQLDKSDKLAENAVASSLQSTPGSNPSQAAGPSSLSGIGNGESTVELPHARRIPPISKKEQLTLALAFLDKWLQKVPKTNTTIVLPLLIKQEWKTGVFLSKTSDLHARYVARLTGISIPAAFEILRVIAEFHRGCKNLLLRYAMGEMPQRLSPPIVDPNPPLSSSEQISLPASTKEDVSREPVSIVPSTSSQGIETQGAPSIPCSTETNGPALENQIVEGTIDMQHLADGDDDDDDDVPLFQRYKLKESSSAIGAHKKQPSISAIPLPTLEDTVRQSTAMTSNAHSSATQVQQSLLSNEARMSHNISGKISTDLGQTVPSQNPHKSPDAPDELTAASIAGKSSQLQGAKPPIDFPSRPPEETRVVSGPSDSTEADILSDRKSFSELRKKVKYYRVKNSRKFYSWKVEEIKRIRECKIAFPQLTSDEILQWFNFKFQAVARSDHVTLSLCSSYDYLDPFIKDELATRGPPDIANELRQIKLQTSSEGSVSTSEQTGSASGVGGGDSDDANVDGKVVEENLNIERPSLTEIHPKTAEVASENKPELAENQSDSEDSLFFGSPPAEDDNNVVDDDIENLDGEIVMMDPLPDADKSERAELPPSKPVESLESLQLDSKAPIQHTSSQTLDPSPGSTPFEQVLFELESFPMEKATQEDVEYTASRMLEWYNLATSKITEQEFITRARNMWSSNVRTQTKAFDDEIFRKQYHNLLNPWNSGDRELMFYRDDDIDDDWVPSGSQAADTETEHPSKEPKNQVKKSITAKSSKEASGKVAKKQTSFEYVSDDGSFSPPPQADDSNDEDFVEEIPDEEQQQDVARNLSKSEYIKRIVNSKKSSFSGSPDQESSSSSSRAKKRKSHAKDRRSSKRSRASDVDDDEDNKSHNVGTSKKFNTEYERLKTPFIKLPEGPRRRRKPGEWWKAN